MKRTSIATALIVCFTTLVQAAQDEPKMPEDVAQSLRYYTGNWTVTGSEGDAAIKGTANFRMPPGKHCILGTVSLESKGQFTSFSFVSGWDSSHGWMTEMGVGVDGGVYRIEWEKVSETEEKGVLQGTLNGKAISETDQLVQKGEDEFHVMCTNRVVGDQKLPDVTIIYKRVPRDAAGRKGKGAGRPKSVERKSDR